MGQFGSLMARRKALVEPDAMAAMPTREGAKRSGPSPETQLLGGGGPPAHFVRPRKKARPTSDLTLIRRLCTRVCCRVRTSSLLGHRPTLYQLRPPFTMAPNRISRRPSSPKARPGGGPGGAGLGRPPPGTPAAPSGLRLLLGQRPLLFQTPPDHRVPNGADLAPSTPCSEDAPWPGRCRRHRAGRAAEALA